MRLDVVSSRAAGSALAGREMIRMGTGRSFGALASSRAMYGGDQLSRIQGPARSLLGLRHQWRLVSFEEGFGLVVTEAAMTGLPSLRSCLSGADDQISHGRNGLLVSAHDLEAMAAELERLSDQRPLSSANGRISCERCT